jgi:hypothetical protein
MFGAAAILSPISCATEEKQNLVELVGNSSFIENKQKPAILKAGPFGEGRLESSKALGSDGK